MADTTFQNSNFGSFFLSGGRANQTDAANTVEFYNQRLQHPELFNFTFNPFDPRSLSSGRIAAPLRAAGASIRPLLDRRSRTTDARPDLNIFSQFLPNRHFRIANPHACTYRFAVSEDSRHWIASGRPVQTCYAWPLITNGLTRDLVRVSRVQSPMCRRIAGDNAFSEIDSNIPDHVHPDVLARPGWIICDERIESYRAAWCERQKQASIAIEPVRDAGHAAVTGCHFNFESLHEINKRLRAEAPFVHEIFKIFSGFGERQFNFAPQMRRRINRIVGERGVYLPRAVPSDWPQPCIPRWHRTILHWRTYTIAGPMSNSSAF